MFRSHRKIYKDWFTLIYKLSSPAQKNSSTANKDLLHQPHCLFSIIYSYYQSLSPWFHLRLSSWPSRSLALSPLLLRIWWLVILPWSRDPIILRQEGVSVPVLILVTMVGVEVASAWKLAQELLLSYPDAPQLLSVCYSDPSPLKLTPILWGNVQTDQTSHSLWTK